MHGREGTANMELGRERTVYRKLGGLLIGSWSEMEC